MKNILYFMIAQCIALGSLTAQQNYFIAGDTSGVLYYDIDPDIYLEPPQGINGGWETHDIDIDHNGSVDFTIRVEYFEGTYSNFWFTEVISYRNNKVGYSYYTSQEDMYVGFGREQGDTINEDILFTEQRVHLYAKRLGKVYSYNYSWTGGNDYIPVCLITGSSSDCIYGWIKVYDVSYAEITLDSYAVDITPTTVRDSPQSKDFNIYPNPAHQELNISTDDGGVVNEIIIFTLKGQQLMKARPVNGTVNISTLQAGMYIVEVMIENTRIRQKLLVQR